MKFSERHGYTSPRETLQVESIDESLRNRLWNLLNIVYWEQSIEYTPTPSPPRIKSSARTFFRRIWDRYFKENYTHKSSNPLDQIREIEDYFFECSWYEIYDLVEFLVNNGEYIHRDNERIIILLNTILEEEMSGYRILDEGENKKIVPVTEEIEIEAIEQAASDSSSLRGASNHIRAAVNILSNKEEPDYRNVVKESISAVESICKILLKDENATLGEALNQMDLEVHPALKEAYKKIYGYTSDSENGIRHAMLEEDNLDVEEAKYMLISCSAFVNYLKTKGIKEGRIQEK